MINKKNILQLFALLDQLLEEKKETRHFIIFGSGSLMVLGISRENRATIDIDLVEPQMDITLQFMAAEIGEKLNIEMSWLNSAGHIFSRNFPLGWKDRTQIIFQGKALEVKTLGRIDLIATKFNAYCNRNTAVDRDDLIDLSPTDKELGFAKSWILSLKDPPDQNFIDKCVNYILELRK